MCGRFIQAQTREEYLAHLADEADVASGAKVLLLNERDEKLYLAPVFWDTRLDGETNRH